MCLLCTVEVAVFPVILLVLTVLKPYFLCPFDVHELCVFWFSMPGSPSERVSRCHEKAKKQKLLRHD
jgi:hypothetical protein